MASADATRATDENLALRQAQLLRQHRCHFARVLHALLAGAGVGVARVHDDGLSRAAFDALDANLYWSGANLIRREHACDGRGHFRYYQREVELFALLRTFAGAETFDVTEHAAGEKALWRDD